ncbi:MAG TPA: hypothetical protein VHS53_04405 [Mucilaginibacter sp.]|jgi:hypothetical protein|nr:hypothetical protein [Mucilaginibacter sp.]
MNNRPKAGLGSQVPPIWEHVLIFFDQAGFAESEARQFFQHHDDMKWKGLKGDLIRNWKTKAQEWVWEIKLQNPHLR